MTKSKSIFDKTVNRCETLIEAYKDQVTFECNDDILRCAVVLSIAALDRYTKNCFLEAFTALISRVQNCDARDRLFADANVDVSFLMKLMKKGTESVYEEVKTRVGKALSNRTFQDAEKIRELFSCFGMPNLINNAECRSGDQELWANVDEMIQRRHKIVHAGDVDEHGAENTISIDFVETRMACLTRLIDAIDAIIDAKMRNSRCGFSINEKLSNYISIGQSTKLLVKDRPICRRVDDVCQLFGAKPKRRGFQYFGATMCPTMERTQIWWPYICEQENYAGWKNEPVVVNGEVIEIREMNVKDKTTNDDVLEKNIGDNLRRVVFANIAGTKCESGYCYQFLGLFELDKERSLREGVGIWRRTATEIAINSSDQKDAR